MSTAARDEAIEILTDSLVEQGSGTSIRPHVEKAVDALLETHTIVRQSPRVHRPSDPAHPRSVLQRVMEGS